MGVSKKLINCTVIFIKTLPYKKANEIYACHRV